MNLDWKIILINEDGEEAAEGEIGELCFDNPYVRGYINLPEETAVLVRTATALAQHARGVGFVEVHQSAVLLSQFVNLVETGHNAVHGEHAVGGDEDGAGAGSLGFLKLGFEVGHVVVGVAVAGSLAEAHAVDDGGVVQGVGDDGIFLGEKAFEETGCRR